MSLVPILKFRSTREKMTLTYSAERCKAMAVNGGWNVVDKRNGDVLEFVSAKDWILA